MASETLLPQAVVSGSDNWTLAAGSNKVSAVSPPDDGATSYISSGTTINTVQRFTLVDPAEIAPGDTINYVSMRVNHQRGGTPAGSIQGRLHYNGNTNTGTDTSTGASFASATNIFNTAPGGGAWTLAILQALEVSVINTLARSVNCSTLDIVVDYTPSVEPEIVEESLSESHSRGIEIAGGLVYEETLHDTG